MTVAILVLAILLALMVAAVLVIAAIGLSKLCRFRAECLPRLIGIQDGGDSLRRLVESARKENARQMKCLLEIQLANNKFLAGHGLPPDPEAIARRAEYDADMRQAAAAAGIDPNDLLEAMREEVDAP